MDGMTTRMNELAIQAAAFEEERPGDAVVAKLTAAVGTYQRTLPLLRLLTQPFLRDRHWLRIFSVLGVNEVMSVIYNANNHIWQI